MQEPNDIMNLENFIKNKSQDISEVFSNIYRNNESIQSFHYKIDVNKFDNKYVNEINITLHGDFVEMFNEMQEFESLPALYLFEINPSIPKEEIISLINEVNKNQFLNIPAQNKSPNNSGVLYVGKVKSCAWGRLIQHLGYHQNRKSHGLQLNFWSNKTSSNIELSYTVMFFDKSVADYIHVLEYELAKFMNPIIGKH